VIYLAAEMCFWSSYRYMAFSWLKVRRKLAAFSNEDERASKLAYHRLNRGLQVCYVLDAIRSIVLILALVDKNLANLMALIYFQMQALSCIISASCTIIAAYALEAILMDGLEQFGGIAREERERGLTNIRKLIGQERQAFIGSFTINILIPWWPWLRAKSSYGMAQILIAKFIQLSHVTSFRLPSASAESTTQTNNSSLASTRLGPDDRVGPGKREDGGDERCASVSNETLEASRSPQLPLIEISDSGEQLSSSTLSSLSLSNPMSNPMSNPL